MRRAAPVLALALALPGCGGESPERERFVAAMERFCVSFDERSRELALRAVRIADDEGPRYLDAIEPVLRDSVALDEEALGQLRRIPASGHDATLLRQLRETLADQTAALRGLADAAAARDRERYDELRDRAEDLAIRRARLVQRLRVERCG